MIQIIHKERTQSILFSPTLGALTVGGGWSWKNPQGVFAWENLHRRKFHPGMTCLFCIIFSWGWVISNPGYPFKPKDQNLNSHLLPLFISYRSSGEKIIKYQANLSCVIMSIILITTLFYKALILQGEIWCWSLVGLEGLFEGTLHIDKIPLQFKDANIMRVLPVSVHLQTDFTLKRVVVLRLHGHFLFSQNFQKF